MGVSLRMRILLITLGIASVLFLLGILLYSQAVYTVGEEEYVLVARYGELVSVRSQPGKYYKSPMIDQIIARYDATPRTFDLVPEPMSDRNGREATFSAALTYQITDPVQFRLTLLDYRQAQSRLGDIGAAILRDEASHLDYADLLESTGSLDRSRTQELEDRLLRSVREIISRQGSFGLTVESLEILEIRPAN